MILNKLEERLGCSLGDLYSKTIPLQFQFWNSPGDFLETPVQSFSLSDITFTPISTERFISLFSTSPCDDIPSLPSTPAKSLIQCSHSAECIPGISYVNSRGDDDLSCHCIHCYLRVMFPRNLLLKSVLVTSPRETCNKRPKSFNVTMEELQGVKSGSMRMSLFLLKHYDDGGWNVVSNRSRIWLNGIDLNFIQVRILRLIFILSCITYSIK